MVPVIQIIVYAQVEQLSALATDSADALRRDAVHLQQQQSPKTGTVLGDGVQRCVSQAVAEA
jgi:hypothetical protein